MNVWVEEFDCEWDYANNLLRLYIELYPLVRGELAVRRARLAWKFELSKRLFAMTARGNHLRVEDLPTYERRVHKNVASYERMVAELRAFATTLSIPEGLELAREFQIVEINLECLTAQFGWTHPTSWIQGQVINAAQLNASMRSDERVATIEAVGLDTPAYVKVSVPYKASCHASTEALRIAGAYGERLEAIGSTTLSLLLQQIETGIVPDDDDIDE